MLAVNPKCLNSEEICLKVICTSLVCDVTRQMKCIYTAANTTTVVFVYPGSNPSSFVTSYARGQLLLGLGNHKVASKDWEEYALGCVGLLNSGSRIHMTYDCNIFGKSGQDNCRDSGQQLDIRK